MPTIRLPRPRLFSCRPARALATLTLLAGLALALNACSLYRNDRCYLNNTEYALARDYFIQTGSLDLVERHLVDLEWQSCQINEALYRLQKEFEVLPEGTPQAARPLPTAASPGATPGQPTP